VQDYLLQHTAGLMQVEFGLTQAAVNGYALSGRETDLLPVRSEREGYQENVAALRHRAAKDLQGYVTQQQQAGARLFGIARRIAALPPRSAAAQALAGGLQPIAGRFYQANYEFQEHVSHQFGHLTDRSTHALRVGTAWGAAALGVTLLLVLATSLSTLWTITRPLHALAAAVRRLTAGDRSARAMVTGSAEVREVARWSMRRPTRRTGCARSMPSTTACASWRGRPGCGSGSTWPPRTSWPRRRPPSSRT
jgi:methyl-accepting chemotaxis protein